MLTTLLIPLATTSPARAADALSPRAKGDLAIKARAILKKHCYECHGGPESRGTIAVLRHDKLIADGPNPVPFVAPGNVAASQVIQFLEDGSMPPGDRPRPTDDEIKTLKDWVQAMAPGYPVAFDDRTTLDLMLRDLDRHQKDAANLRYFSFAHLIGDEPDPQKLDRAERSLHQALTWCKVKEMPEPVDDCATLYRFDVRPANWNGRGLFYRVVNKAPNDISSLNPYDLILLEYPYGYGLPAAHPLAARLEDYFKNARLVRRVPFLRGDWLAAVLAKDAPLADDIRSLTVLSESLRKEAYPALGKEKDMPCGPVPRAFAQTNPVPAAPKPAATLPILPLSAWYSGDSQADPAPFTLKAEIDVNGKSVKSIALREGFKLRVNASQKVYFVLLAVWSNGEVVVQETNMKGFLEPGETLLTPKAGLDTEFKITGILINEPKATEYFVLLAAAEPIPMPLIIRSRHARNPDCEEKKLYPISRFVFNPNAKFDQTGVVRRVVAVTVTEKKPN